MLEALGRGATYVGEGDRARLVKICHNLALGIVAQTLAEITVLAEKGGISRADFLAFFNDSVMGSMFSRYKTPALVTLDYTPTFTPKLLLKDFDLGLDAADELGVSVPVVEHVRALIAAMIEQGYTDVDFAAMLSVQAAASGLELVPEPGPVSTGSPSSPGPRRRSRRVRRAPRGAPCQARRHASTVARHATTVVPGRCGVPYRARGTAAFANGTDGPDPAEEGGE